MAELKTKRNKNDVHAFIRSVEPEQRRKDAFAALALFESVTGEKPEMWGDSIIGFGSYHYKYASGREAEWMLTGFSPRKQNLTIYIMSGFDAFEPLLKKLGKYKTGKSCLYINRLADVDMDVLRELVRQSIKRMASQETEP